MNDISISVDIMCHWTLGLVLTVYLTPVASGIEINGVNDSLPLL